MQFKEIKIKTTAIEKGEKEGKKWTRVDIITEEGGKDTKYSFFSHKSDGTQTKAFEYFMNNKSTWDNALLNDEDLVVNIGFEETEVPYVGKDGISRTSKRRTIRVFKGEPLIGQPIGDQNQAEYRIKDENTIDPSTIPF